jgi:hypothetical protein
MTGKELLSRIAARRKSQCLVIRERPWDFKVCRACQSLCFNHNIFCPSCRGYGFETEVEAVLAMAKLLGKRRLALGCAVLPRGSSLASA